MQGDIFNSKGVRVGVIVGREIFDLNGTKLYDLKGTNIYRLSGEFIGHLNDASGSDKRLDGGVAASLASLLVDKSMRQFSEHTESWQPPYHLASR